jgi:hypothetical protein
MGRRSGARGRARRRRCLDLMDTFVELGVGDTDANAESESTADQTVSTHEIRPTPIWPVSRYRLSTPPDLL